MPTYKNTLLTASEPAQDAGSMTMEKVAEIRKARLREDEEFRTQSEAN